MRTSKTQLRLLCLLAAFLWCTVFVSSAWADTVDTSCYDEQIDAYARMNRAMEAVKRRKQQLGIALSPLDTRETGMIGEEYNALTTTLGALEAKRTTADPNMAAMIVRMLTDAGLTRGDRVGAGFSGSFPALNIAVLSACDAMGISITYISSVGASTYGANNPLFTFPEMAHYLYKTGFISSDSALVTMGGDYDTGFGMDESLSNSVRQRLDACGLLVMEQPDYSANLDARKALYDAQVIECFVAVGGNTTSLGLGENAVTIGQGLLKSELSIEQVDQKSGLVQWYLSRGLPVINLLNIKQIVANYGMPFDPAVTLAPGESAVFRTPRYPRVPLVIGAVGAACVFCVCIRLRKSHQEQELVEGVDEYG